MKQQNLLFILSNGKVGAINKKDGEIIWEVNLKQYAGNTLVMSLGQLIVEENKIYLGASGILLCLSTKDGSLIWKNELKGWGYNFVNMANVNNDVASAASMQQAAAITATIV